MGGNPSDTSVLRIVDTLRYSSLKWPQMPSFDLRRVAWIGNQSSVPWPGTCRILAPASGGRRLEFGDLSTDLRRMSDRDLDDRTLVLSLLTPPLDFGSSAQRAAGLRQAARHVTRT